MKNRRGLKSFSLCAVAACSRGVEFGHAFLQVWKHEAKCYYTG